MVEVRFLVGPLQNEQKNQDKENTTISQENHYNKKLNKCLVKVNLNMTVADSVIFQMDVRDAYEGKSLLVCYSGSLDFCVIPANISSIGKAERITNDRAILLIASYMN